MPRRACHNIPLEPGVYNVSGGLYGFMVDDECRPPVYTPTWFAKVVVGEDRVTVYRHYRSTNAIDITSIVSAILGLVERGSIPIIKGRAVECMRTLFTECIVRDKRVLEDSRLLFEDSLVVKDWVRIRPTGSAPEGFTLKLLGPKRGVYATVYVDSFSHLQDYHISVYGLPAWSIEKSVLRRIRDKSLSIGLAISLRGEAKRRVVDLLGNLLGLMFIVG